MKADANQMKTLFDTNGFLKALDALDEKEMQNALEEYEKLEKQFGKEHTQYYLHNSHLQYEWVMNLASHPNILKTVTSLLGPNVILLDSRFICKYPVSERESNKPQYVAWHQDIKYWGCKGGPIVTVWLAFDDVDTENGAVKFIPGSHKLGILDHKSTKSTGNGLPASLEVPENLLNLDDIVECPLKSGQMSVHNGLIVHASEPNTSKRRRCGFVARYTPTTAYPDKDIQPPRTYPGTVLVAGTDEYKHFEDHAPMFFSKTL